MGTKKELIVMLNSKTASEQVEWFKNNSEEACHLFWWLIGYAHLDNLKLTTKEKGNK